MHHYVSQHAKNICLIRHIGKNIVPEKNILYDSPTVEQFLNFFTELFNQGVSHRVLISAKSAVAHVLRMKYQHILEHLSVIKFFKGSFNLRPPLPKLSFVWDVQIMLEYFRSLGDNRQISKKTLITKTPNTVTASRRVTPKLCISFYN